MLPNPTLIPSINVLIGLFYLANIKSFTRPSSQQLAFLPIIVAVFMLIAITNTVSNIPFNYAPATSIGFSLGLSFTVFIAVTLTSLLLMGIVWFGTFCIQSPKALMPFLILIELVSYLARGISLGVRLFANLTAGHSLLNIIASMLLNIFMAVSILFKPIIVVVAITVLSALIVLELAVAQIQAYVFAILTNTYEGDSKATGGH